MVGSRSGDARGGVASRVLRRQDEPDVGIGDEPSPDCGHVGYVRVLAPEVLVQDADLALDLRIRDVFGVLVVDDDTMHLDFDWPFWSEGGRPERHPLRGSSRQLPLSL